MIETNRRMSKKKTITMFLGLVIVSIALNIIGTKISQWLGTPFYIDNIGTILAAAVGGYLPCVTVGFFYNIIMGISQPDTTYYCFISVLIAASASYFARNGWLKKFPNVFAAILTFAAFGGGLGCFLTWLLGGFSSFSDFGTSISASTGMNIFVSDFIATMLIDIGDKAIVTFIAVGIWLILPKRFLNTYNVFIKEISFKRSKGITRGRLSLRTKALLVVGIATTMVATAAGGVSILQYHFYTIKEYIDQGNSVTEMMQQSVEPNMINEFITKGKKSETYRDTCRVFNNIRKSSREISYIYIYKIDKSGCTVVLDIDTEDLKADAPGDKLSLDDFMKAHIDEFEAGKEIETTITNDSYGWLLTVYKPINDHNGKNLCYVAVDLSMQKLFSEETMFLTRIISMFLGFLTLIMVFALWITEHYITEPINQIASTTNSFDYDSPESREKTVKRIKELDIHTGDEIENLYNVISQNAVETVGYIEDIEKKGQQITKLQRGLIIVLADLVESRDKCTGDHVRKTAAYTEIIMKQMKKEGIYTDILTDEYIEDVVNSAPLHDIGKIQVPDALLNKPGKLTDEEFKMMQSHTTAGGEIIQKAIKEVDEDSGYLNEAKNLANFHHEKWNGKGYPLGLNGEEIPLSARVMAVADVFDALVSRRSYKEPFPIEKAIDIIRNEAGEHFDANVVKAFLDAEDEIRRVAKMNMSE